MPTKRCGLVHNSPNTPFVTRINFLPIYLQNHPKTAGDKHFLAKLAAHILETIALVNFAKQHTPPNPLCG